MSNIEILFDFSLTKVGLSYLVIPLTMYDVISLVSDLTEINIELKYLARFYNIFIAHFFKKT